MPSSAVILLTKTSFFSKAPPLSSNLFYRKYPDEVLEKDPISITNLKINVDVEIDGTTITGNTL